MRLSVVLHYAGFLLSGIALAMLLPLAFSLHYGESDWESFFASILITLAFSALLFYSTQSARGIRTGISRREALALVTLSWILASIFGALPYFIEGTFSSYLDCFFESMSGFTTTGASVMTSIDDQPHGILLWRDFTQWLGGMGIVVLFVSLFPLLGVGTAYLFEAEAPGPEVQKLRSHMKYTSRAVWVIYIVLTGFEFLLLYLVGGLDYFDSLTHAFGTMATGGFSPQDASIGAYDSLTVNLIVISFMFIAGINFALYYGLFWHWSPGGLLKSTEFRWYVVMFFGVAALIVFDLVANSAYSLPQAAEVSAFSTISVQTTTGFAISDFASDDWPAFSQVLLLGLMVLGASAGSTGGGFKIVRLIVLFKYAYRQILLAFNPRAVIPIKLGGRVVSDKLISKVLGFSVIYFGVIFFGTVVISFTDGLDFVSAISAVISAISNVGPGLGFVGPAENYAFISAGGKVTLIICMLVGRLELLTVFAIFAPAFWRWR